MSRDLRTLLLRTLAHTLVLEVLIVPAVLFWPKFSENLPALKLMAPLEQLRELIAQVEAKGAIAYMLAQHLFKGCNTVGIAAAVLFASGAVAGEAQRGTLEIWLARGVTRKRLLAERWLQGALAVCLPVFLTTATLPWLCARVDEQVLLVPLMWCAVQQSLFLLAVYALTFLWSTVGKNPWPIATVMLFACTLQFALYMIETATHWSLMRWSDVQTYLAVYESERLATRPALVLGAVVVACALASWLAFERRRP